MAILCEGSAKSWRYHPKTQLRIENRRVQSLGVAHVYRVLAVERWVQRPS